MAFFLPCPEHCSAVCTTFSTTIYCVLQAIAHKYVTGARSVRRDVWVTLSGAAAAAMERADGPRAGGTARLEVSGNDLQHRTAVARPAVADADETRGGAGLPPVGSPHRRRHRIRPGATPRRRTPRGRRASMADAAAPLQSHDGPHVRGGRESSAECLRVSQRQDCKRGIGHEL